MSEPSLLIVGAGRSGQPAALELKRRGFSPRIIDKEAGSAVESQALVEAWMVLDLGEG